MFINHLDGIFGIIADAVLRGVLAILGIYFLGKLL